MNVNTDLVKGDDLFLYIYSGGTGSTPVVLAFATSCELSIDQETIDTSNKMSCRWNSNLAGKSSYTISADALYTQAAGAYSFDSMMAAMVAGTPLPWAVGQAVAAGSGETCEQRTFALDTGKQYYKGEGLITSLSLSAGNNEVASCSITITGSGEIQPVAGA